MGEKISPKNKIRAAFALYAIAALFRVIALWYPQQVVFDEVHFGKFVTAYTTGERTFDIHPPHAKLLIAFSAWLGGIQNSNRNLANDKFTFEKIGQSFPPDLPTVALRIVPAIAGSLVAPLLFWLLLQLGVSLPLAFGGGFVFALDNAFILQSRVISLDMVLLASSLFAMAAYFEALKPAKNQWWWFAAAGAASGLAVGSKITALAILGLLGCHFLLQLWINRESFSWAATGKAAASFGGAMVGVYLFGWWMHIHLLNQPGPGDSFYQLTGDFFTDLSTIHQTMLGSNFNLKATHQDSSPWWSWPLMKIAPYYWVQGRQYMYLVGNPVVWWGGTLLFLMAVFHTLVESIRKKEIPSIAFCFAIAGYLMSLLPFVGIPRVLFLYHYFTPLLFSWIAGLLWLNQFELRPKVLKGALAVVVAGFITFSPLTYGVYTGAWSSWLVTTVRSWR